MRTDRLLVGSAVAVGVFALAHAAFGWPVYATLAFFGGGALVAFNAEAVVINRGWLEHHVRPKAIGVPLYVLFGWTGTVYVAFRVALLATDGWIAIAATGVLATAYDILVDHRGVAEGLWTYTDDLPGPRYRGVPWWNFVGWFVISCLLPMLTYPFL